METVRTFVAFRLPGDVQRLIGDLVERLHVPGLKVRWVEPENLHLTVKFLGEVPTDRLDSVFGAVEDACRGVRAFRLSLDGVGAFPNLRWPRVVWVGLGSGRDEAERLAASVEDRLADAGFAREDRSFKAHVTVGRVKERSPLAGTLGERIAAERLAFEGIGVHSVEVMKSQLTRQGPIYTVQKTVALVAGEGSG